MFKKIWLVMILFFAFSLLCFTALANDSVDKPIPQAQWTQEAKLVTAQSCAGEAGFAALDECFGIAWVYATRSAQTGVSYKTIVKQYSRALKKKPTPEREWILGLNFDGKRPKGWPAHLKWSKHKPHWEALLDGLDLWAAGKIQNPVPGANHFGGKMDEPGVTWKRVKPRSIVVFRNRFWSSKSS